MSGRRDDGPALEPPPDGTPEDRIRRRAADALERGLAYVRAHGDDFAVLYADALLGARPVAEALAAIAAHIDRQGALEPVGLAAQGAPGLADVADDPAAAGWLGCLEAMIVLSDLGALTAPVVDDVARCAERIQSPDGSWGSTDVPADQRIFATGMLGGHLARTRAVHPDVLMRAGEFLSGLWSPDRVSGRSWPALAAFGAWFSSTGTDDELADGALQSIGRELERGHRQGVHDAVSTVRVLLHCDAGAVPGAGLVPGELLEALLGEQGADGGFAELAMGPDSQRVVPTLDAMLGAIRLCGVL